MLTTGTYEGCVIESTKSILVLVAMLGGMALPAHAQVIVEAWGSGSDGQLGNGTTNSSSTPVAVSELSSSVAAVEGGGFHNLALQNGGVYAWGFNSFGQLGNGATSSSSLPVAVTGLSGGVTAVAGGYWHSLAVRNGAVYSWGYNGNGQLGNGSTTNSSVPVAVNGLSGGVTAIACGALHSLALQNGGVFAWGYNQFGQLGNGTAGYGNQSTVPVAVSGLSSGVTAIAGGADHSLAIQNGGVYAWGSSDYGQLGNGTYTSSSVPSLISGLSTGATAIAAGEIDSLAVMNGNVYAWGWNYYGQLGDGSTVSRPAPEEIDPTDLNHIVAVAANSFGCSSYALSTDGSIWDWGYNADGELGLGNTATEYATPQHLLPPSGYVFTSIAPNVDGVVVTLAPAGVPEPVNLSLLAVGSLALLFRRRRADVCGTTVSCQLKIQSPCDSRYTLQ